MRAKGARTTTRYVVLCVGNNGGVAGLDAELRSTFIDILGRDFHTLSDKVMTFRTRRIRAVYSGCSSSSNSTLLTSPTTSAALTAGSSTVNVNAPVFVPKAPVTARVSSPDPFRPAYLRDPCVLSVTRYGKND